MIVNTSKGQRKFSISEGKTILHLVQEKDIYLSAPCGGRGTCGKCKIKVATGSLPISLKDKKFFSKEELEIGYRLACSAYPQEDLEIIIDFAEEGFCIVSDFQREAKKINHGFEVIEVGFDGMDLQKTNSAHLILQSKLKETYQLSYKGLSSLSKGLSRYIHGMKVDDIQAVQLLVKEGIILDVFYRESIEIYGIAIDIGTTTLGFHLVDLHTGEIRSTYSKLNSQRMYGADVISRIQRAEEGNLERLKNTIIKDITTGIEELLEATAIDNRKIYSIAIAGNTTMMHLLLGLSPTSLGQYPFTATTLSLIEDSFQRIFGNSIVDCNVALLPGIDAYVGGDIVAGILHHEMFLSEKINMLIDIGTNGEIVIGNKDRMLATATAAGPALEGGNISCGTGCVAGAIASVAYHKNALEYKVIGNQKPIGICGSGVIDTIAEGLMQGWIDYTGRLSETFSNAEIQIYKDEEGSDIKLTQKDIREIQLAKSSIRSGIECLIKEYGISYEEINYVYLAGGFGSNINIENAVKIGLIPDILKDKIKVSGNTCLGGTIKYLLDKNSKAYLDRIVDKTKAINLSMNPQFNDLFVENMLF